MMGWGSVAAAAPPVLLDTEISAAETDWRPREQLPASAQARLPSFCEGGYLPSWSTIKGTDALASQQGAAGAPLQASGLSARYEIDNELYLQGNVRLSQGRFQVSAAEARYREAEGRVAITGPLVSRGEGFLLTGDEALYSVDSGHLYINNASFLLHGPEMRGRAASLSRIDDAQVVINQGFLTTCGPHQNDWAIVASEIQLDQAEGFGTARHLRLEVLDLPVFYWPWVSFPIDERRKSGFLYPSFGSSNTGSGGFVAAPYYFNLAPNYDATLTPQFINGRGLSTELEGRYLSRFGETTLQLGYVDDDGYYRDQNPGENGQRWALDASTEAALGSGWTGYGDFSVVSDEDYLSDLNRSLDISQATHLQRRGGLRYEDASQYFDAYLNSYQTVAERIAEVDRPYAQLPEILYAATAGAGAFELSVDSQFTYFQRDNDNLTGLARANGQRLRLLPELALPMRALWGYSRPSISLDHTHYQLEDYTFGRSNLKRTVPVAEWDNGLYFDRQSSLFDVPFNQTLEPRLYYAWADADADQNRFPDFDTDLKSFSFARLFQRNRFNGGDRVGDTNQLTVALTSRFNDLVTGAERVRASVGQIQYFEDREVIGLFGTGIDSRSRSSLAAEVALNPLDNLEVSSSLLWDPNTNQTEESRSQLTFHSADYRYLVSVGHTYSEGGGEVEQLEQADLGVVFPVSNRLSLIGRWVHDTDLDRTVGSLAGVEYNNCCWSLQVVHQNYFNDDQQLDSRILFQIQLKGLGGAGGASASIADAIYGYDERERRRFRAE